MSKTMGIICILAGGLLAAAGIVLLIMPSNENTAAQNSSTTETTTATAEHSNSNLSRSENTATQNSSTTETTTATAEHSSSNAARSENANHESINHGLEFEKFIVDKFNKEYFKIVKWTGDKISNNGRHDGSASNPDLVLELEVKNKNIKQRFAVECKWRKSLYKGGFDITQQSFGKYKKFEQDENIPVFIVIGLGGSGNSPERLFVVPLRAWQSGFLLEENCRQYEVDKAKKLYYDEQKKVLK